MSDIFADAPSPITVGSRVRIVGLQGRPELNGMEAVVTEWRDQLHHKTARWKAGGLVCETPPRSNRG